MRFVPHHNLFAHREFKDMDREVMNNTSLRDRFGVEPKNNP